jgi:fructosamine-3-kinase
LTRDDVLARLEAALGQRPTDMRPLSGGSPKDPRAEVYAVTLRDRTRLVAKVGAPRARLSLEGWMLRTLRERSALPVPAVVHSADDLLVMELLPSGSGIDRTVARHAAELIAALHGVTAPTFGLERDTLIGGLHQPNAPNENWIPFFREQRLLHITREGERAGRLGAGIRRRIETLCERLDTWIREGSAQPSLIHGDLWGGNVLAAGGRITGFVDPAIYYADPEIELAFTTLFGTFGEAFFRRYGELRPLRDGFFEERRDLYNLYPLLVHVRLFGGGYLTQVEATLRRFGC